MPCPEACVTGNAAEHPVPGRPSVVWYARDWLLAFSPRPLDLGKATSCVSVFIHVLFWLLRRFGFMCIVSVEAAGTAQPGTSAWTLANFRCSKTHALNLEIKSIT